MTGIPEKLAALRAAMAEQSMAAWIITSADPHQSEYVATHWTGRAWLSGFTGSAGTLIVLAESITGPDTLWTDGRYFVQAEQELRGSGIRLKRHQAGDLATAIGQWLAGTLPSGSLVGFDGNTMSLANARKLAAPITGAGNRLQTDTDLLASIWLDRPPLPAEPVYCHEEALVGSTGTQKLAQVRSVMVEQRADHLLLCSLDDIAWLLNLRGQDIDCNPVFLAYVLLTADRVQLYTDTRRITPPARARLQANAVQLHTYQAITDDLGQLTPDSTLLLDPATTSYQLFQSVPTTVQTLEAQAPTVLLKAIKHETEIAAMANCHRRDGVAMVRFLRWLAQTVPTGGVDEIAVETQLQAYRAEDPAFQGPSFPTIAGYGPNGAICHYRATPATCLTIQPQGLLLVDSGAQYPDGTTDITRTVACGDLTDAQRHDYTVVLKSHINLARARFKKGTRGMQLDMLARQPLWALGLDYNHGTGHGVGYFLNVHEGPHSVSTRCLDVPLQPGMLLTNEPGLYREGQYGIRIENIMRVTEDRETSFGQFYKLVPLTLAPIDTRPVFIEQLSPEEITWLNQYHDQVQKALSPLLHGDDWQWLVQATQPIAPV